MAGTRAKAVFIEPMLLLRTDKLPEGKDWLYELKFDGYRALAIKSGGRLRLRSRNDNDFSVRYPGIADALAGLTGDTVIDGEVVALDADGKPSFNLLQNYGSAGAPLHFFVFDVLVLKGKDVMAEPLEKRRELLEKHVLPKLPEIYPDSAKSPGFANPDITQDNIADNLCSPTWSTSSIRSPTSYTNPLKVTQMQQYGDSVSDPTAACMLSSSNTGCYEEDHLISLENGGHPRDPRNLWPEPYNTQIDGQTVGARRRIRLRTISTTRSVSTFPVTRAMAAAAHASMTLQRGQDILAGDWYACFVTIKKGQDCK